MKLRWGKALAWGILVAALAGMAWGRPLLGVVLALIAASYSDASGTPGGVMLAIGERLLGNRAVGR